VSSDGARTSEVSGKLFKVGGVPDDTADMSADCLMVDEIGHTVLRLNGGKLVQAPSP
jgi:hypothetical protein